MSEQSAGAHSRPNVLFIMADQWSGRLMGHAGHPAIQTPTLDALAASGVRFPRAYSESPICIPARRTVMTGTTPRTHGDRMFKPSLPMPGLPTLAQCFRDAGYQAQAVGKMHVYPQRDRIGFDEIILAEEGRPHLGAVDDYDMFLADQGFAGQQFMHGMNNNEYVHRPWHLPENCHITNWTTDQMARTIKRRDPTRPAFWHLSYTHPHPPLVPLGCYLDLYRDVEINPPVSADWAANETALPVGLRSVADFWRKWRPVEHLSIRRAFYALCTHIDHQLRVIIGTLREEGLLENTIIVFTTDHGDMLGDFGLWAKRLFLESSANVPMILVGAGRDARVGTGRVDHRLVGLQDVMPTLLELAGIPIPESVEGLSMVGEQRRELLHGECREDIGANRMMHDGRYKLIWYPAGNRFQLFDLEEDPGELTNRADDPALAKVRARLEEGIAGAAYGVDDAWVEGGRLVGAEAPAFRSFPNLGLSGQRGLHYPQPPVAGTDVVAGMPWEQL
jgi:arylsulfatase